MPIHVDGIFCNTTDGPCQTEKTFALSRPFHRQYYLPPPPSPKKKRNALSQTELELQFCFLVALAVRRTSSCRRKAAPYLSVFVRIVIILVRPTDEFSDFGGGSAFGSDRRPTSRARDNDVPVEGGQFICDIGNRSKGKRRYMRQRKEIREAKGSAT